MNFNKHYELTGKHAMFSASKNSWLNYSEDKLVLVYSSMMAKQKGTELHEIAAKLIDNGIRLPQNGKTLSLYVNDGIGYKMATERTLVYQPNPHLYPNFFGTADAIAYSERRKKLRIHDLKTGSTPASMDQLMIYASLFCLEYDHDPADIDIELRIYQNNEVHIYEPELDEISHIIDRIISFDKIINELRAEES